MIYLGNNRLRPYNIDIINRSNDDSVMSNVTSMTNLTDPDFFILRTKSWKCCRMRVFHVGLP